jgi:hypothetical protein
MMRTRSISRAHGITVVVFSVLWIAAAGWMFGTHRWGSLPAVADACGSPAPDVRFAPPPGATLSFIEGCRSRGAVAAYAHLQVLDLAYPTLVAGVLASTLLALTRHRPRLRWLALIPVAASLGDYLENVGAWTLISGKDPAWALYAVQEGSFVKTTLSWFAWLTVITLVGAWLATRLYRPRARQGRLPGETRRTGNDPHGEAILIDDPDSRDRAVEHRYASRAPGSGAPGPGSSASSDV